MELTVEYKEKIARIEIVGDPTKVEKMLEEITPALDKYCGVARLIKDTPEQVIWASSKD